MNISEYRTFGRTGVKVSPVILGAMMFGGRTDPSISLRIIDRALDAGINFIDTANIYADGESEKVVGHALSKDGRRARVFLATKVHMAVDDTDPNALGSSRRHIIAQAEESLRRLGTDHIDLYQMHRPAPDTAIDETLRALDDLIRAGKVRYIGCSTFAGWQLVEALWAAKELGLNRFVAEQPPYSLVDRRIERELIPAAQTFGLAIIPWSPMGGGILTGKYRRGEAMPANSRYTLNGNKAGRVNDRIYEVVEQLTVIAEEKSIPLSQLAIAWVMQQSGVTSTIIGPRTEEQLEDAIAASSVTLSTDDLSRIDRVVPPGTHVSPFYEPRSKACHYRW